MNDNIKLPPITEDDQKFLHYNPNTDDIVEWVQAYAREAVRLNSHSVPDEERLAMEAVMESVDPATWPGLTSAQRCALGRFAKPEISTKHGPWVESTLHEGETYCKRCLTRSIFAGNRECDPHIVAETEEPAAQIVEDAVTWQELESFRKRHWAHWNAQDNLLIAHLVQTLRTQQITTPAAPQPLTDEQIEDIADDVGYACVIAHGNLGREVIWFDGDLSSFARAIERAHGIGIKND